MHVVHHSSQEYNLAVALRQGWTKHFTGTMLFKVPLVLIGFDPVMVTFCGVLNATYQFMLHTETVHKLPRWFEAVFNTPSHHRVHHAANPRYVDRNYGGTLMVWDRLFGTFAAESDEEPCRYGLIKNIDTYNPLLLVPLIIAWMVALKEEVLAQLSPRPFLPGLAGVAAAPQSA